ncbi:MAG: iron chelate uptake ABC transporter family permease subunit, partial [Clostridia bacterium]|nr:iron chelate uptake ABC transporter family permease subunit [Clostridia bacterium]
MEVFYIKKHLSTVILGSLLFVTAVISLFIGVLDLNIGALFSGDSEDLQIFLLSRLPRLLAILCTGIGMSVAGLIMQQLCMNKFVSPTTGATIQSAQFGIALAMVFFPTMGLFTRTIFAFIFAVAGTI